MDILASQVNDYLKEEYELSFLYDEEKSEFNFSIDMKHVSLDVRIICREEDKQVLMLAYVPIKIQENQYSSVLRLINKIQMDNLDSVCLFINEDCNKLMSQSALNVGSDFRIDKEVFRFAFCPLLNILDDYFVELLKILSREDESQKEPDEISALASLSEQNDPEAQYLLGIKYYKGEDVAQDMERAIGLWNSSLSNGRKATTATLQDCIEDLTKKVKKASDSQEYEKSAYFQTLINRCNDLLDGQNG